MTEDAKKLNKYYILVLVLILIVGIISATYAFFQVDTSNDTASTTITANSECFNITFEEISDEELIKLDINYPITDKYALGQTDNQDNVKPVVVKVSNKCTQIQDNLNYKLVITTLAKNPINEQDKGYIPDNKVRYNVDKAMNEETKSTLNGPAYLNSLTLVEDENILSLLNEEITKNAINIKEYDTVNTYIIDSDSLASNNTSTYYIRLWIDYYEGDSEAYTNPENHVKDNEYDNSTQGQNFESVISLIADGTTSERTEQIKSTIDLLREKDSQEYLSEKLQGGMYRYQAAPADETEAAKMTNWIVFGTNKNCEKDAENNCTNIENMSYDDYVDKYMYRIIGITEEDQLYLIKETFIKEDETLEFKWNGDYHVKHDYDDYCRDEICPYWNGSLLFKRINGINNGTLEGAGDPEDRYDETWTDIFVDNSEYDYLKSGDSINGTKDNKGSEWYQLIANHDWTYGDTADYSIVYSYNGDAIYDIEHGNRATIHYIRKNKIKTQEPYTWDQKVSSKISLMYIHDYYYSYYDGLNEESRGNSQNYSTLKNSWIYFQKDGYNISSVKGEWLSTRSGLEDDENIPWAVFAFAVDDSSNQISLRGLTSKLGSRPVFYLSSDAKIVSGDGTKSSPYILG